MLSAFKDQLNQLSEDANGDFHKSIKKRVGKRATELLENRLRHLILLMPDLLRGAHLHWERKKCPSKVKKISGFLMTYLYHSKDFLDESEHGFFGYLDDAYLTAVVYQKALEELASENIALSGFDSKFAESFPQLKRSVKVVIPEESAKIEKMIDEILLGEEKQFQSIFQ